MPIPSRPDFKAALRTHATSQTTPEQFDELLQPLLAAWEAVLAFQPLSTMPVAPPWSEPALAFEAAWADTNSLIVAVRVKAEHGTPAQIMLRRAGQLEYAFGTSYEHLAEAIQQRLSRHHVKRTASTAPAATDDASADQ
ncbi:hypothetical protein [Hymenobacter sp. CRA2]|uniref:hypothetical protein n=1 Tax=Hymenobacter sp. CRA2 TaxID=1955620 RepID=UPI00098FFDC2|nr:hypothetical protein [Hymenobacter sp. CRA2]OON66980.1 hypothetical protein B0919_20600 [Hymenobacter sp. CRA2]